MPDQEHFPSARSEAFFTHTLEQTIEHLKDNWFRQNTGIVAATIVDGKISVSATSMFLPLEDKWQHAESSALLKYRRLFGKNPKSTSTMVVTLSPCMLDISSRLGASCTNQLVESGIHHVRFGYLDTKQTPSIDIYQQFDLDAKLVGDPNTQHMCADLYHLFHQVYDTDGKYHYLMKIDPNPWNLIKPLIGLTPFLGMK